MDVVYECLTGFAAHHHQAECIGLVHIPVQADMEIDMMTSATKDVMEAGMMSDMAEVGTPTAGKGNGATGMMIGMAEMETLIVVMEIAMAENTRSAMVEMVTEMMITGEEVEALTITSMAKEVEALIETESALLMMMVNILLGMSLLI